MKGGLAPRANIIGIHLQYHQPHLPPQHLTSKKSLTVDHHHLRLCKMAEEDISGHYEVLEELGRMFSFFVIFYPKCPVSWRL